MTTNKTTQNEASVAACLAAIEDEGRRRDCEALSALMSRLTQAPPVMWGTGIVGFDRYHYRYESGREGDAPVIGFSARKGDISVYLSASAPDQEALLARLGRHKMGKACLSLRKLADVDMAVLEQLVAGSMAEVKRLHG